MRKKASTKTPETPPEATHRRTIHERSVQCPLRMSFEGKKQLAQLALDLNTTPGRHVSVNSLLIDAVNMLFNKHNLPENAAPPEE